MSDRMALLHAKGEMAVGDQLTGVSIIGSEFHGKILGEKWSAKQPQFNHRLADSAGSRCEFPLVVQRQFSLTLSSVLLARPGLRFPPP